VKQVVDMSENEDEQPERKKQKMRKTKLACKWGRGCYRKRSVSNVNSQSSSNRTLVTAVVVVAVLRQYSHTESVNIPAASVAALENS